jgi:Tfp pilus assembly protein PilF
MSLLMDALRRAEQEKKQQQERGRDSAEEQGSGDEAVDDAGIQTTTVESPFAGPDDVTMQIEPVELERASETTEHDVAEIASALGPKLVDDGDDSRSFSLEDDGDNSHTMVLQDGLELEPLEQAELTGDDTHSDTNSGLTDLTGGTTVGGHERVDQTSTLPSTRAVENDLNAYFDQSQSQSLEMPRRSPNADMTLEDVAAHTVVGAQTVFAAGERPRSKRVLIVAVAVAVVIVLAIGVVGLFYAQQSPGPRYIPPPTVADGVERPRLRELPVVPLEQVATDSNTELVRVETHQPSALALAEQVGSTPITGFATVEIDPALLEPEVPRARPAPLPPTASSSAANAPEPAAGAVTEVLTQSPADEEMPGPAPVAAPVAALNDVGVGQLTIARTRKLAAVDDNVMDAYTAFNAGDLDRAQSLYAVALADNPDARDARLGLGATALARGDPEGAYLHYSNVLKAHPGDAVATASILSLTGAEDGLGAARLRLLLDRYADSPYLHFALGNWYAVQGRWGDAQQAYFDAVRLDKSNADYAFNLAVSLDHLGKPDAALDYYQQSLSLADSKVGNFNPASVLERINTLSSSADIR